MDASWNEKMDPAQEVHRTLILAFPTLGRYCCTDVEGATKLERRDPAGPRCIGGRRMEAREGEEAATHGTSPRLKNGSWGLYFGRRGIRSGGCDRLAPPAEPRIAPQMGGRGRWSPYSTTELRQHQPQTFVSFIMAIAPAFSSMPFLSASGSLTPLFQLCSLSKNYSAIVDCWDREMIGCWNV
jgi:hypothetical protein